MKLAEAKIRLNEIKELLNNLKSKVSLLPLQEVSLVLAEMNSLVSEGRQLRRSINKVEYNDSISGSCINELELAVELLEDQVNIFKNISERRDLPESLASVVFSQLDSFVRTKTQLQSMLLKASWEIEVIL